MRKILVLLAILSALLISPGTAAAQSVQTISAAQVHSDYAILRGTGSADRYGIIGYVQFRWGTDPNNLNNASPQEFCNAFACTGSGFSPTIRTVPGKTYHYRVELYRAPSDGPGNAMVYGQTMKFTALMPGSPYIYTVAPTGNYITGLVPGSMQSVYGEFTDGAVTVANTNPWPTTLAGITVFVNGLPAPIWYVSQYEIRFQASSSLAVDTDAVVRVERPGFTVNDFQFRVSRVVPTVIGVLDVNFRPLTTRAPLEKSPDGVYRFNISASGLGLVDSAPADGFAPAGTERLMEAPTVTIDDVPATVTRATLFPGYAGAYLISVEVQSLDPLAFHLGELSIGGKEVYFFLPSR